MRRDEQGECLMRVFARAILLSCAVQGCATVRPPRIDVLQARLTAVGLLDQHLQVQLCVSNPNPGELAFSKVTANVDIGGEHLASAVNDTPVTLPPLASVVVPFTVATTTRNLVDQLGSILASGSIRYAVSGHVVLRDFSLVGIPYSVSGRLTPQSVAGQLVSMTGEPDVAGPCGQVPAASGLAPRIR